MLIAFAIFLFTLVLVIWQPRGLGIGWSASIGALLALALGSVAPGDIPTVWNIVWNATATFIAVIVISLLLDEAGFFEWAALHVARWAGGDGRRLFAFCVLLGAAVSALFANDGAALILTPIVMSMLLALRFSPAATLAFVMAAGFIADSASLPLVVSNLVNIVSADYFGLGFGEYAAVMLPVNLVSVATSLLVLFLYFRRDLPPVYALEQLKPPRAAIRDRATFVVGGWMLLVLLAGLFALEPLGVPVSAVAATCAALLLAVAGRGRVISTRRVLREAPWQIVVFSLGMYLVVYGLKNAGLTDLLAQLLNRLAEHGVWAAALGTGLLSAALSSVMNNMPSVLLGALSIQASDTAGAVREAMIYANVIGCDLGPKITPIGSLATLLWLHVLARKGMRITWGYYFRVGALLTLPVLLATLSALALRLAIRRPPATAAGASHASPVHVHGQQLPQHSFRSHVQPPGPAGFRGMQRRQPAQRAGASAQPGDPRTGRHRHPRPVQQGQRSLRRRTAGHRHHRLRRRRGGSLPAVSRRSAEGPLGPGRSLRPGWRRSPAGCGVPRHPGTHRTALPSLPRPALRYPGSRPAQA